MQGNLEWKKLYWDRNEKRRCFQLDIRERAKDDFRMFHSPNMVFRYLESQGHFPYATCEVLVKRCAWRVWSQLSLRVRGCTYQGHPGRT